MISGVSSAIVVSVRSSFVRWSVSDQIVEHVYKVRVANLAGEPLGVLGATGELPATRQAVAAVLAHRGPARQCWTA